MRILFVTWDGPQVNYLESLFLPILEGLSKNRLSFCVLQFTWADADHIARLDQACRARGIQYEAITIGRKFRSLGAVLAVLRGARVIRRALRSGQVHSVLSRSTFPALATLLATRALPVSWVFDADGLPLDERVDFAGWSATGLAYRLLREVEAQAVRRAAVVLTRTRRAIEILEARAGAGVGQDKFKVVGNGRDPSVFNPGDCCSRAGTRSALGLGEDVPLLIYAGSLGAQYCIEEMLRFFALVSSRRPDAHLLFLTGEPGALEPALAQFAAFRNAISIIRAAPGEVPGYLACADLGLALRKPDFSMQAVAPIKLGEYLLCGVPVVLSDCIEAASALSVDVVHRVSHLGDDELARTVDWFVTEVLPGREAFRSSCEAAGVSHFSLDRCIAQYRVALEPLSLTVVPG